jgi:ubiquitin-like-conjugating enzyme ATG3
MNLLHGIREYVAAVPTKSTFTKTGRITPEEFVAAGDYLVFKCPTWKWCAGDPKKRKDYLPAGKQYLVTKNVPCLQRVAQTESMEVQDGEWTVYKGDESVPAFLGTETAARIEERRENDEDEGERGEDFYNESEKKAEDEPEKSDEEDGDCDGPIDISNYTWDSDDETDPAALSSSIILTRTYDLYITYDKWYQTPRVWLFGYNESRNPLTKNEMFEDVSSEHVKKTVTYEYHPHEKYMALSVHPCKHANVMKELISRSGDKTIRSDQYLCLFLKFIGTVIPTITYDYSIAM